VVGALICLELHMELHRRGALCPNRARKELLAIATLGLALAACSGNNSESSGSAGAISLGGSSSSTGGNAGTAGVLTQAGASSVGGGTSSFGGTASGGASSTGGSTSKGGASSTSNLGGAPNTGGTTNNGGAKATGGNLATGGIAAVGGTSSNASTKATGGSNSAGAMNTGGSKATGGTNNAGGTASTGGTKATGGASVTGGAATGGASTGQNTTYQNQQAFVDLRYGMFIHFNMGTFTNEEWATPNQNPLTFAPTDVNTDQWAAAAKAGGMKFAVLTTKHHDGFCLWPTKLTSYNVMNSSYKVDIVKKYVDSFRAAGVTPALYFSIWDRTQGIAQGSVSKADLDFIVGQLTELLGGTYGTFPVIMFDGWSWQMGHNAVPYQLIRETVKSLQPNILVVDHNGLIQPFEEDLLNFEHFQVPTTNTYPSTQGNPIMPKWFWHPGYDGITPDSTGAVYSPMAASSILSRLTLTDAHWCNLLLDCPPNRNGVLDKNVVDRLAEVAAQWKPSTNRAALPAQPIQLEHPVSPVAATATSGTAASAIDGMNDYVSGATVQSLWQSTGTLPQSVTLDFGSTYNNIEYLGYMPRQDHVTNGTVTSAYVTTGNITSYNIYSSTNGTTFALVTSGTWAVDGNIKRVQFTPVTARYLRLEATAASGATYAVASEIDAGGVAAKPVIVGP
jgi:alpha-L-fucosidase